METKVNYVLVGSFVLALGALLIAGVLWIASGGAFQKKFDRYLAIEDESVAGLNLNAPVKYNGVAIGRVEDIVLDAKNPARVRLLFALERGTPIKTDTVAMLKTQGLTGIAYVELSGGTPASPALRRNSAERYPVITTKPSLSARLENVLTTVLEKLDHTSSNIDAILSDDNRRAFASTLADVASVARTLASRKETLDAGIQSAARTFDNSARVSAQLGAVAERVGRSADALARMGLEVASTSSRAGRTVDLVGSDVQRLSSETLPEMQRLMSELNVLSASLRRLSEQTERNPRGLLFGRGPRAEGPGETTEGARRKR